jgi:lipopolysaccharide transport system ATP-binding protein
MTRPIIEVRNVSKSYQLGVIGPTSLKAEVSRLWDRARGRVTATQAENKEFWALRDVAFDVQPGEVVGIIGRNGSGKSTLLKILSRITQQTSGEITLRGRVASLLEVGTGFHPDLTGRENVFLNGAILGMMTAEIRKKFDEIVAFAEIEQFIDTPVKRYSSGMYVRLAFAVAAHLEPEVLIVDEVLAVGDVAFQRKCLGKMDQVAGRDGRTVLFVSHNMAAIQTLCSRGLLLESGSLIADGTSRTVIAAYAESTSVLEALPMGSRTDRDGNRRAVFTSVGIESMDTGPWIQPTSRLKITLRYEGPEPLGRARLLVGIYDDTNIGLYALESHKGDGVGSELPPSGTVTIVTDPINLTPGSCYLSVALVADGMTVDYVRRAASFVVADSDGDGVPSPDRSWVLCVLNHQWSLQAS